MLTPGRTTRLARKTGPARESYQLQSTGCRGSGRPRGITHTGRSSSPGKCNLLGRPETPTERTETPTPAPPAAPPAGQTPGSEKLGRDASPGAAVKGATFEGGWSLDVRAQRTERGREAGNGKGSEDRDRPRAAGRVLTPGRSRVLTADRAAGLGPLLLGASKGPAKPRDVAVSSSQEEGLRGSTLGG